jgi:hypothetical protein
MNKVSRAGVLVGAFSLAFLSACVSTYFTPAENFEARNLPPVSPAAVRVLRSASNERFQTLGEIKVEISGFHSGDTIIRKARERAATIGADTIVFNHRESSAPGVGNDLVSSTSGKIVSVSFTAIRLLPGD